MSAAERIEHEDDVVDDIRKVLPAAFEGGRAARPATSAKGEYLYANQVINAVLRDATIPAQVRERFAAFAYKHADLKTGVIQPTSARRYAGGIGLRRRSGMSRFGDFGRYGLFLRKGHVYPDQRFPGDDFEDNRANSFIITHPSIPRIPVPFAFDRYEDETTPIPEMPEGLPINLRPDAATRWLTSRRPARPRPGGRLPLRKPVAPVGDGQCAITDTDAELAAARAELLARPRPGASAGPPPRRLRTRRQPAGEAAPERRAAEPKSHAELNPPRPLDPNELELQAVLRGFPELEEIATLAFVRRIWRSARGDGASLPDAIQAVQQFWSKRCVDGVARDADKVEVHGSDLVTAVLTFILRPADAGPRKPVDDGLVMAASLLFDGQAEERGLDLAWIQKSLAKVAREDGRSFSSSMSLIRSVIASTDLRSKELRSALLEALRSRKAPPAPADAALPAPRGPARPGFASGARTVLLALYGPP